MEEKRFYLKEKTQISEGILKITVDRKTGVNYLTGSDIGVSGLTPLLDEEGKPIITKEHLD